MSLTKIFCFSLLTCKLVLLTQYCSGDETEKNEMGEACSACWGNERRVQGFDGGNLRERDTWGDPGVARRIILMWIFRKWNMVVWTGLDYVSKYGSK
jgi:hypothetical protein